MSVSEKNEVRNVLVTLLLFTFFCPSLITVAISQFILFVNSDYINILHINNVTTNPTDKQWSS